MFFKNRKVYNKAVKSTNWSIKYIVATLHSITYSQIVSFVFIWSAFLYVRYEALYYSNESLQIVSQLGFVWCLQLLTYAMWDLYSSTEYLTKDLIQYEDIEFQGDIIGPSQWVYINCDNYEDLKSVLNNPEISCVKASYNNIIFTKAGEDSLSMVSQLYLGELSNLPKTEQQLEALATLTGVTNA